MQDRLLKAAAILAGAVCIGWVAVWNGYPIVSGDSAGYIRSAFSGLVEARRPSLYPVIIALLSLKKSLWLVVAAQCLLASHYLFRVASCFVPGRPYFAFSAVILVACSCTTLPWFAGRVMPDIPVTFVIMGSFLLLVERPRYRSPRLWVECVLLLVLTCCHVANIAVLLVISAAGYAMFSAKARSLKAHLTPLLLTCSISAISALILCGLNFESNGRFTLTDQGDLWTMARLVRYGIVQRMLDQRCNVNHYALCPYRDGLSDAPDHFVFSFESPLRKIGGWDTPHELLLPMMRDANKYYWKDQLGAAVRAGASQFAMVQLNMGLGSHRALGLSGPPVSLRAHYRSEYTSYLASRQRNRSLRFERLNAVIVPTFWLALFVIVVLCIWAAAIGDVEATLMAVFFVVAISMNAGVMGVLNAPFDRYQARTAWLIPAIMIVLICRLGRQSDGRADTGRRGPRALPQGVAPCARLLPTDQREATGLGVQSC